MEPTPFQCDAIIVAGGRSTRMGQDKAQVDVGGTSMLELSLAELAAAGVVRHVAVVSPQPLPVPPTVTLTCEDPPFGGPVAGIEAGLAALTRQSVDAAACDGYVFVMAVDAPFSPRLIQRLRAAVPQWEDVEQTASRSIGVSVVAGEPLCALWRRRALAGALAALPSTRDVSVRRLIRSVSGQRVRLDAAEEQFFVRDYDNPAEVAGLNAEIAQWL